RRNHAVLAQNAPSARAGYRQACAANAQPQRSASAGPPLGDKVAFLSADGIMVVDGSTGLYQLRVPGTWNAPLASSPDQRLLTTRWRGQAKETPAKGEALAVHVWEAVSGKEV